MTAQAGSAAPSRADRIETQAAMQTGKRSSSSEIAALRRAMRARRNALPMRQRVVAAKKITALAVRHRLLRSGMWIAAYLPFRSEMDALPLMRRACALDCRVFVPRVTNERARRMEFVPWSAESITRRNRFNIDEPAQAPRSVAPLRRFDVIFLPLVAFSADGWRLGSGAGFYDRRLAQLRTSHWRRPRLIGIAYDAQRVDSGHLRPHSRPWDVPLDAVLTESGYYLSSKSPEESR
jgi:5-formyltetrahydrofolate cyclo-ligase